MYAHLNNKYLIKIKEKTKKQKQNWRKKPKPKEKKKTKKGRWTVWVEQTKHDVANHCLCIRAFYI